MDNAMSKQQPAVVDQIRPVVFIDEAGNTGENLVDLAQPIFALAAIHVDEGHAEAAVDAARSRTQMFDLKFSGLQRSNPGRKNILTLLEDMALDPTTAAVSVTDKPWMLAAKLTDELIEPRMLKRGVQMAWYATGGAKRTAEALQILGPRLPGNLYAELAGAFVVMVRDYAPEPASAYLSALTRCRIACTDANLLGILNDMIDTAAELEREFGEREDALDPALPALFWQAGHWSTALAQPFEIRHDESKAVRGWVEYFTAIRENAENAVAAGKDPVTQLKLGPFTIELPTNLEAITFGASEGDARLLIADMVAGAAARSYASMVGLRTPDSFDRGLAQAGIGDLLSHQVGPG
jgi:hypothetical protein